MSSTIYFLTVLRKEQNMNDTANSKYIWDAGYNYPISIHIYGGDYSQSFLQSLSNRESLTVRDYRKGAEKVDYFPQ